ncbi:MAG: hypothetical protein ACTSQE_11300 [Candidatus Heimdallarchaeaceae archaeon]
MRKKISITFFFLFVLLIFFPTTMAKNCIDNKIMVQSNEEVPFLSFIPLLDGLSDDWGDEGLNDSQYTAPFFDYDGLEEDSSVSASFKLGIANGTLFLYMIFNDDTPVGHEETDEGNPFSDTIYIYFDTDGDQTWTDGTDDVKIIKLSNTESPELIDGYYTTDSQFHNEDSLQFEAISNYANSRWNVEIAIPITDGDTGDLTLNGNETLSITIDYQNAISTGLAQIDNGYDSTIASSTWEDGILSLVSFNIPSNLVSVIAVRNISPAGTVSNNSEISIKYSISSNTPQLLTAIQIEESIPSELKIKTTNSEDELVDIDVSNTIKVVVTRANMTPGFSFSFTINFTVIVSEDTDIILEKLAFQATNAFGDTIELEIGSQETIPAVVESSTTSPDGNDTETSPNLREGWYWWLLGAVGIIGTVISLIFLFGRPKE